MKSVTAKEMYNIDRKAMEDYYLSGVLLMENAGRAITEKVLKHLSKDSKVVVLVGAGNNGGDGFVIARTLANLGFQVNLIQIASDQQIKGDAAEHKAIYLKFGYQMTQINQTDIYQDIIQSADVIIDAMLGIGFQGELKEPYRSIVKLINSLNKTVIAVDLPSGVPAETVDGPTLAVQADFTYCIEAPKPSAFIERYANFYGEWETVEIGLPKSLLEACKRDVWTLDKVKQTLPKRDKHSHKGSHGRGLVIGGHKEMPGAVRLTATSALRSGVGLLTVGSTSDVLPIVSSAVTEATYMDLTDPKLDFESRIQPFDAIAIGMGMGRSDLSRQWLDAVIESDKPIIIDADGLYFLKSHLAKLAERKAPTILTPHPGEMAMLIDQTIQYVKNNPFEVAKDFAKNYQVYLVLKGAYTIVTCPNGEQTINTTGNPGLAKGGSGDCLAGIILAQIMQKGSLKSSLANACYIHGLAADLAIEDHHSTTDLLATDLINFLPDAFRKCLN